MKKFILYMVIVFTVSLQGVPITDIPEEFDQYHTDRLPQFLIDFYDNAKQVLNGVKEYIINLPDTVYQKLMGTHSHVKETAYVRFSEQDDISEMEKLFLTKRLPIIKKQLENMFQVKLKKDHIPRIGFIFSGGGFRAMLMTLGFLKAAEETGLLDTACYCAALSGSTWAIAPWIASGKTLDQYMHELIHRLASGIDHINDPYEINEMINIIVTKLLSKQLISTMDIYGGVIANTLLKKFAERPMMLKLSESHASLHEGILPLPIYTAIQTNHDPYEWMEISPFEIGSSFLKAYIPTWAYGRKFKDGVSTDFAPEQTLGYFLGVFGSAFELSLRDVVQMSTSNLSYYHHQLPPVIAQAVKRCLTLILDSFAGQARLFPSMLSNFTYLNNQSPIADQKTIQLVDAGIDFNLPFPPLLRPARKLDILIIYDTSATVKGAPELYKAQRYAERKGIKFPPIDYEKVDKELVSVFYDPMDKETPMIIYFPRIKNDQYTADFDPDSCIEHAYCNTFNFKYAPEQAGLLCGFGAFTLKERLEVVKQAIAQLLTNKYDYSLPSLEERHHHTQVNWATA